MIDEEGFRANVGIILSNNKGQVFWARRVGSDKAWQFPQGGIKQDESVEEAMYRELYEEVGLLPEHVDIIASTDDWLKYWLPEQFIRHNSFPLCIGQKQIWYYLRMKADDGEVKLDSSSTPEFDEWKWVDFWYPMNQVVEFKRNVYTEALNYFAPLMNAKF